MLERKGDRSWRETVEANVSGWWDTMQRQAMTDSDQHGFVNPQRLLWELTERPPGQRHGRRRLGSSANWYARHLRFTSTDARGSLSGNAGHHGPGVPYVIGAKFAHPDRPAIAFVGRRRHADERHGRAHHRRAVLAGVVRPSPDRGGPAQQRPEPGDLGDAGHGRRPRSSSNRRPCPTYSYAAFAPALVCRPSKSPSRTRSAGPGTRHSPPTGRRCSTFTPIPTSPRSRPTPPSIR